MNSESAKASLQVSRLKTDEFYTNDDEFCIRNDEFCINNDEVCISNDQEHGLAGLDADSDGHISHDEFLKAVNDNPKIMEMFGQVVH